MEARGEKFESSDNPEGSQTPYRLFVASDEFESSDNPEGSQTIDKANLNKMSLRVVIIQRGLKHRHYDQKVCDGLRVVIIQRGLKLSGMLTF